MNPIVSIIAAVAQRAIVNARATGLVVTIGGKRVRRVIGANNALPWDLPGDLRRFKTLTMGKPIIMGRRTFESIGKPLPGRRNIVITRNLKFQAEGVELAHSLENALELARIGDPDEIFIIGGGQIYAKAMKEGYANRMYITEVNAPVEDGDAFFPIFSRDEWKEMSRESAMPLFNPAGEHPVFFVRYERKED